MILVFLSKIQVDQKNHFRKSAYSLTDSHYVGTPNTNKANPLHHIAVFGEWSTNSLLGADHWLEVIPHYRSGGQIGRSLISADDSVQERWINSLLKADHYFYLTRLLRVVAIKWTTGGTNLSCHPGGRSRSESQSSKEGREPVEEGDRRCRTGSREERERVD